MAAIDCSSKRWKSRDFVEVLREGFWLVWPSNEFISEAINCICNTSDDSTYARPDQLINSPKKDCVGMPGFPIQTLSTPAPPPAPYSPVRSGEG